MPQYGPKLKRAFSFVGFASHSTVSENHRKKKGVAYIFLPETLRPSLANSENVQISCFFNKAIYFISNTCYLRYNFVATFVLKHVKQCNFTPKVGSLENVCCSIKIVDFYTNKSCFFRFYVYSVKYLR